MQAKGIVNCYTHVPTERGVLSEPSEIYTMNMNAGTTPFMITIDGKRYTSRFCNLPKNRGVNISYVFYRPGFIEFQTLDLATKLHILQGGLVYKPLNNTYFEDNIHEKMTEEELRVALAKLYGTTYEVLSKCTS